VRDGGRRDRGAQALGGERRPGQVALGHQPRPLLAAHAFEDVGLAEVGSRELGDGPQGIVAGAVAVPVVHLLEVVDVEQGQAQGAVVASGAPNLLVEPVMEGTVVEEAGERIGPRQPCEVLAGVRARHGEADQVGDVLELDEALLASRPSLGVGDGDRAPEGPLHAHRSGQGDRPGVLRPLRLRLGQA
jgi:hypothetical protein